MKQLILSSLSLLLISPAFSQANSPAQIDKELHWLYQKVTASNGADDKLADYDNTFRKKLESYTSKMPTTLTYTFDSLLSDHVYIVNADDNLLRIYSWDNNEGGTMRYFENVFQYKTGNKVFSFSRQDTIADGQGKYLPFYSQIYTLQINGKVYYLAIGNGIYSNRDISQSIEVFAIEDDIVKNVKIIKTPKHLTSKIDVSFDFFSVTGHNERPMRLIKYDNSQKIISIPIVDKDGKVSKGYIRYKFTGQYFEKI